MGSQAGRLRQCNMAAGEEVEPYRFGEMALLGEKLPANLLRSLASRWEELRRENATLRAVLNGALVSVPDTLYDACILRELEKQEDEFMEARLIGQVLGKYRLGIGDAWIALLHRAMDTGWIAAPDHGAGTRRASLPPQIAKAEKELSQEGAERRRSTRPGAGPQSGCFRTESGCFFFCPWAKKGGAYEQIRGDPL